MKLLAFQEQFATEQDCRDYLIKVRWPQGYRCVACGHGEAWYLPARHTFDCKKCRKTYSVTADTIFHKTHTPLREWFWAIFLMVQSKKGISTLELQRLLGAPYYDKVFRMQERIRQAMEARENLYHLEGFVEVDEAFFGGHRRGGKRGKGSENKTQVLVQASIDEDRELQYAKMTVIPNGESNTLVSALQKTTLPLTTLYSDGNPAYNPLYKRGMATFPE